ncbi:putative hydrolase of the HAD superfamily [Paenibacillus forsythiae]|uniref:Hydrolase of the HAD superfamily n=1 Tax=Paenibacillus forsythiae TaxID=365616 RepID=A0ABU3HEB1_9BACL|nr:HAD-IA family hydrolase [Paenibacillus forsythiae]MDT3429123.1 putative hydrolase of the HAD superfamily [Paenibacillus forsythiae]
MSYRTSGKEIKAILFDSGRVLNGPRTGHWFITPNFFNFIDDKKFRSIDKKSRDRAFHNANAYISKQNLIRNEAEEFYHFAEYYRIFSDELSELGLTDDLIKLIATDLVYNYEKYKFYTDVIELIPELSRTYKLAVVSDAWPSLDNVFRRAGLRDYFSSFIISSVIGVSKPHELMYRAALEELNMSPNEVLFIDDNVRNCDGAEQLGIRSIVLSRDWKLYFYNKMTCKKHDVVRNLNDVIRRLR